MTQGPDGAMWFTLSPGKALGRIDSTGKFSTVAINVPSGTAANPVVADATSVYFLDTTYKKLGILKIK